MGWPSTSREQPHESAVVRRLRKVSLWNILAGVVVVFAMMLGLGTGLIAAVVFAVIAKGIEAAFSQRIREHFERQPDLRLAVADDGELVDTVKSRTLRPWPFNADRVIVHEVTRLQEEATAVETLARKGPLALLRTVEPFARQPSERDYQQAREQFTEKLNEYERALRAWLEDYAAAAVRRASTFELSPCIISTKSGAYAEDVVLTIDLPECVEIVEQWPTVSPPPDPPTYIAPRPHSTLDWTRPSYPTGDLAALMPTIPTVERADVPVWQTRREGRSVQRYLGNMHHDSTVELDGPLLLRATSDGHHTLTWTLRTKNGHHHRTGSLELVVPPVEQHLPFARLQGIESYPDVPFVDEDGQVIRVARTSDPPTEPPSTSNTDEVLGRLADIVSWREWQALGLDRDEEESDLKLHANAAREDDVA